MKKIIFTILLCVSYSNVTKAQDLSTMPINERNAFLISIAKDVVLTNGPDFYREYREPIIEREQVPFDWENAGRFFYTVTFLYDSTQERLEENFAARVRIWADTGRPKGVTFGTGISLGFGLRPRRSTTRAENIQIAPVRYIPYQQAIVPIYDRNDPDPNREPLNIDELTRHGRVRDSDGNWVRTRPDTPPADAQRTIRRAQEDLRRRQANRDRDRR